MGYFKKISSMDFKKTRSLKWTVSMFFIVIFLMIYLNKIAYN